MTERWVSFQTIGRRSRRGLLNAFTSKNLRFILKNLVHGLDDQMADVDLSFLGHPEFNPQVQ